MSEEQKRIWRGRMPLISVSILILVTTYIHLWSWVKIVSLSVSNYRGVEVYYLPALFGKAESVDFLWIPITSVVGIYGWLLSTRVTQFKTPKMRVFVFFNMLLAISGVLAGFGMSGIQQQVLPFFYQRLGRVIETSDTVSQALFSETRGFFFMLVMLPLIVIMFIGMYVVTRYRLHDKELKTAFFSFQWNGERLRKFEEMGKVEGNIVPLPDIQLGISKRTNEMVTLPGVDRTLNTIITGSIGTGKTAALGLPVINQDLHYITRFMNDFPKISMLENYKSEDIQGKYLNGLSIIEPSNDLCKKVYKLAKAHNIPDEAITYIDPLNPKTPSINVMQGPTEKVAEVFAQVIAGLADNGGTKNFYFEQAQRNHLKQHIYLLKMHNPNKEVTFDMLIDMYNNTKRVHEMHMQLKKRFPAGYENIQERDTYNYWQILKGVDEWFDKVVVPLEIRTPQGLQKVRDDNGDLRYIDTQETDVQGLRNILNDIGNNILIRRVLFGPSKFSFDDHMGSAGGILLVNTAKGDLGDLGSILGKVVLMTLQNASFRREPYISTYHHILVDEAPEYLYSSFSSFPSQSRKYKVIITILQQTLTQLRGAFGEDYMNNVIAAMRNRMVYADVSSFDAKYFSDMFGEKEIYQEGESEQSVSPLQEAPITRTGSTYSKQREARMSGSDILYQDAFECAVKVVVNNKTMPVEQIRANFVPKEEFEKAIIQVDEEVVSHWIAERFSSEYRKVNSEIIQIIDEEGIDIEDIIIPPPEDVEVEVEEPILNYEQMETAVAIQTPTKPKEEDVNYKNLNSTVTKSNNHSLAAVTVPYSNSSQEQRKKDKKSLKVSSLEEQSVKATIPLKKSESYSDSKEVNYSSSMEMDKESKLNSVFYTPKANAATKVESSVSNCVKLLETVTLPKRHQDSQQKQVTVNINDVNDMSIEPNNSPSKPKKQEVINLLGEQDESKNEVITSEKEGHQSQQTKSNLKSKYQPVISDFEDDRDGDYMITDIPNSIEDFYKEMKK